MSQKSVAYQLFHQTFMVRMQNKFYWSEKHIQRVPGLSSTNEDQNSMFLNEYNVYSRTPVGLILLYDEGILTEFVDIKDSLTVYNLIIEHLNNWGKIISNKLSVKKPPPPEELLMMENFAEYISEQAMFEKATQMAKGVKVQKTEEIDNFLDVFGGRRRANLKSTQTESRSGYVPKPIVPREELLKPQGSNLGAAWDVSQWGDQYYGDS